MAFVTIKCPNCQIDTIAENTRKQCYCLFCGYKFEVNDSAQIASIAANKDDGKVAVTFVVGNLSGLVATIDIDGTVVCSCAGGSETVRVSPGVHTVHAKANALVGGQVKGTLKEGSRINISIGFMGLNVSIM